jgi:hypothetical protein
MLCESDVHLVRRRLAGRGALASPTDLAGLVSALGREPGGVLLLDPGLLATEGLEVVLQAAIGAACTVILYGASDKTTAHRLLDAIAKAPTEPVVKDAPDGLALLARLLTIPAVHTAEALVLRSIAPQVRRMPAELAAAVTGMFGGRTLPEKPADLFSTCRASRRTCQRSLQ